VPICLLTLFQGFFSLILPRDLWGGGTEIAGTRPSGAYSHFIHVYNSSTRYHKIRPMHVMEDVFGSSGGVRIAQWSLANLGFIVVPTSSSRHGRGGCIQ
jgi:hypothetical protein